MKLKWAGMGQDFGQSNIQPIRHGMYLQRQGNKILLGKESQIFPPAVNC